MRKRMLKGWQGLVVGWGGEGEAWRVIRKKGSGEGDMAMGRGRPGEGQQGEGEEGQEERGCDGCDGWDVMDVMECLGGIGYRVD